MLNKKVLLLISCCSLSILIAGLTSVPSLGDEISHYRFAKAIYNSGSRTSFDPLYGHKSPLGYFYNSPPFWHTILALFWGLIGRVSSPVAQFYHTIYYALLILFTYLLGRELYGEKEGLYTALIVATIPAIASFSLLFYIDIPGTCLILLCILLIIKKQYFWSGIILGLTFLTKRNACFFAPALLFLVICQAEMGFKTRIKNLFCFTIPISLFVSYDFLWRHNSSTRGGYYNTVKRRLFFHDWNLRTSEYLNSSLFNPIDIIKYFGLVLLILLAIYVLFRKYEKKDVSIWLLVVSYYLAFCYIFYPGSDVRHILPVMPLLAVLASKPVASLVNKRWLKILLVSLCFLQFASTILYVRGQRQIPKGIMEGFTYLRENTDPDALIMYPEYIILEQANRKFVWAGNLPFVLRNLFWNKDEDEVRELLKSSDVDYVAVKKSRIYDDSHAKHFGGYPKSFVKRLPKFSFIELVFDNQGISIWHIKDVCSNSNI
jgi:4-amino-4-deoxy-L-arabinose transferase-like glycosyltransferase